MMKQRIYRLSEVSASDVAVWPKDMILTENGKISSFV